MAFSFGRGTGAAPEAQKHAVPWQADALAAKQDLAEESESGGGEEADALMSVAFSFGGRVGTGAGPQAQKQAVPWRADGNLAVKQDAKQELSFESESGDVEEALMSRLSLGARPKAQAAQPTKGVGIGGAPAPDMMRDLGFEVSAGSEDLNQSLEPPSAEASSSLSRTPRRSNPLSKMAGRGSLGLGRLSGSLGGSGSGSDELLPGARALQGSLGFDAKENRPSLSGVSGVLQRFTGKVPLKTPGFGGLNLDELRQATW